MSKKLVRLTEGDLHRIIKESVETILKEAQLNELDPRTYASYAQKRAAQGDQMKANAGVEAAQNKWNQMYGSEYDNGSHDWGYTKMGGQNFSNNFGSNYGINHKSERPNWDGKGYKHTNMAYNPKTNQEWVGDGKGNSKTYQSERERELGDNGAYRVAREMENGSGKYIKGKGWQ